MGVRLVIFLAFLFIHYHGCETKWAWPRPLAKFGNKILDCFRCGKGKVKHDNDEPKQHSQTAPVSQRPPPHANDNNAGERARLTVTNHDGHTASDGRASSDERAASDGRTASDGRAVSGNENLRNGNLQQQPQQQPSNGQQGTEMVRDIELEDASNSGRHHVDRTSQQPESAVGRADGENGNDVTGAGGNHEEVRNNGGNQPTAGVNVRPEQTSGQVRDDEDNDALEEALRLSMQESAPNSGSNNDLDGSPSAVAVAAATFAVNNVVSADPVETPLGDRVRVPGDPRDQVRISVDQAEVSTDQVENQVPEDGSSQDMNGNRFSTVEQNFNRAAISTPPEQPVAIKDVIQTGLGEEVSEIASEVPSALKQLARVFVWHLIEITVLVRKDTIFAKDYNFIKTIDVPLFMRNPTASQFSVHAVRKEVEGPRETITVIYYFPERYQPALKRIKMHVRTACERLTENFVRNNWDRTLLLRGLILGSPFILKLLNENASIKNELAKWFCVNHHSCKVSTRDVIRRALDFMITLEATSCGKSVDEVKNRRLPQGVDEFFAQNEYPDEVFQLEDDRDYISELKVLKGNLYYLLEMTKLASTSSVPSDSTPQVHFAKAFRVLYDYRDIVMLMIDTEPMKLLLDSYFNIARFESRQYLKQMLNVFVVVSQLLRFPTEEKNSRNMWKRLLDYEKFKIADSDFSNHAVRFTVLEKAISWAKLYAEQYEDKMLSEKYIKESIKADEIKKLAGYLRSNVMHAIAFEKNGEFLTDMLTRIIADIEESRTVPAIPEKDSNLDPKDGGTS